MFAATVKPVSPSSGAPLAHRSDQETVIARGVRVEGEFKSQGNVIIEGELSGTLHCGGHLMVGPEALIKATIQTGDATISGKVMGDITANRRLELKPTAQVSGNITAEQIAIDVGAALEGNVKVGGGGKREAPAPQVREKKEVTIGTPDGETSE